MATETPTLKVSARETSGSGASGRLRHEGMIPGVCYGPDIDSFSIALDPEVFKDVLEAGNGKNTVFRLEVDGGDDQEYVLLRDFQFDPVKRSLTHIDLFSVSPDRTITVEVPIEPRGEAEGVHMGGQLQIVRPEVPVRCTPTTIPTSLTVDVDDLGPNDSKKASDIIYPEDVEAAAETDFPVVRVMMPREGVVGLEEEGPEDEEEEEVEGEEAEGEEAEGEEGEGEEGGAPGAAAPGAAPGD